MNGEKANIRPGIIGSLVAIAIMLALAMYGFTVIPPDRQIPTHWNIYGQVDGYSTRTVGLLVMPAITASLLLLFAVITRVEPRIRNLQSSMKAYNTIWLCMMGLLVVSQVTILLAGLGIKSNPMFIVMLWLGGMFVVLGNYLGKVRSNFFMGIRTPWTLSSEYSWNMTHRLGGVLFVLVGLGLIAMVFLTDTVTWTIMMMGEMLLLSVIAGIYSYAFWRADPARRPQTGPSAQVQTQSPWLRYSLLISIVVMGLGVWGLVYATSLIPRPSTQQNAVAVGGPKADENIVIARAAVRDLASADYTGVYDRFDSKMQEALPVEKLKSTWEMVLQKTGPFAGITGVRPERVGEYTAVHCITHFERANMDIKVVLDSQGKIAGLWFNRA